MECVRAPAGLSDVANLWYVFVSPCSSKIALSGSGSGWWCVPCHGQICGLTHWMPVCLHMYMYVREGGREGEREREREREEGERERKLEQGIMMCIPFDFGHENVCIFLCIHVYVTLNLLLELSTCAIDLKSESTPASNHHACSF